MKDTIYNPEGDGGMDILLWEFIDGSCNESEKTAIEKLIAENIEWKAKYHELLEVHQLIGATDLDAPSMRFTKNVMEEIAKNHIAPATNQYINNKIIWGIAAFFITVIVSFVIYGFSQVDWSVPQGKTFAIPDMDFSAMFNNTYVNVFMMINVILGLMLFDRYLEDRKKQFKKQAF
jgi:hypothetical protein